MDTRHSPTHRTTPTGPAFLRWIEAERRGDDHEAERHLAGVFEELGPIVPRPGFAQRILVRAGLDRASRRERRHAWLATLVGTISGGTLASLWLWSAVAPATWITSFGDGVVGAAQWLGAFLSVVARMVHLGELARTVAATPELTTGLLGLVALATFSWTSLAFLLERSRHVEA